MADGLAEPGRLDVRRMFIRQVDVACHMIFLPDHHDLLRGLEEIHRRHRIEQEARNADRPAALLGGEHHGRGQSPFIDLAQRFPGPWLQDRVGEIGDAQRRLPVCPPGGARIEIGVCRVEDDRSRPRRRRQELLSDRVDAVGIASDPTGAAVRGKVWDRGLLLRPNRAGKHGGNDEGDQARNHGVRPGRHRQNSGLDIGFVSLAAQQFAPARAASQARVYPIAMPAAMPYLPTAQRGRCLPARNFR